MWVNVFLMIIIWIYWILGVSSNNVSILMISLNLMNGYSFQCVPDMILTQESEHGYSTINRAWSMEHSHCDAYCDAFIMLSANFNLYVYYNVTLSRLINNNYIIKVIYQLMQQHWKYPFLKLF